MQRGVVFPQTEIGSDPGGIRAYATALEASGYKHVLVFDHVLGADPAVHEGFNGPYHIASQFHEPFVLFGFLAGFTELELISGVIVLPQRQAVLVAKQAAEVDVLTNGKLRLGVGLGWNTVEYAAMGSDFHTRGSRIEEQITLMRKLWTEPVVSFEGDQHSMKGVGILPLPVQRPIPVWIGASSDKALHRAGRIADGWLPHGVPGENLERMTEIVQAGAREAGRDPSEIQMEGRIQYGDGDLDRIATEAAAWRQAGADYVSVNTMGAGFDGADAHIAAVERVAPALEG